MTSCADCAHARWQMTKHANPRPNPKQSGRCTCPSEGRVVILPRALIAKREVERMLSAPPYSRIWFNEPFADCPTWAPINPA